MTTNRTSRRAEDFDRALAAEGGAKIDPTMAALVAVAGALAALPQRPAPAFRDGLRAKLMAEAASLAAASVPAASVPAASVPAQRVPGGRTLAKTLAKPAMQVATGGLAATIAATGLTVGTSRSLPGDALYGLKRTVEGLQVGAAGGATAEAVTLLKQAETRLDEVQDLLDRGDLNGVRTALATLAIELNSATSRLLAEARAGSRAAYDRLQAAIADLTERLVTLLPKLPPDERAAASLSLATLNVAAVQLGMMVRPPDPANPQPSNSPAPTTPTSTGPSGPSGSPTSTGTPVVPTGTPTLPTATPTLPTGTPTLPTGTPTLPTGTPTVPPLPTGTPTLPVTLPPLP
jgi:hypothetical protein